MVKALRALRLWFCGYKKFSRTMEQLNEKYPQQRLQADEDQRYEMAAKREGKRLYQKWLDSPKVVIDGKECNFSIATINPVLMGKRTYDLERAREIDFKEIALNEMERLKNETPKKN